MLPFQTTPDHLLYFSMQGELILAMTYGYEPQGRNDKKVEIARQLSRVGSEVALPGALLVNDLAFRRCYSTFRDMI
jgi:hypothetical protein